MTNVKQLLVDKNGLVIVLRSDGSIARQVRVDHRTVAWEEVPVNTVEGPRLVQLAVTHEAMLIGVDASGQLHQVERFDTWKGPKAPTRWTKVPGPDDVPLVADEAISSEQSAAMVRRQLTLMKEKLR